MATKTSAQTLSQPHLLLREFGTTHRWPRSKTNREILGEHRSLRTVEFENHNIRFYPDYSAETDWKQKLFDLAKRQQFMGLRYGMLYPAVLMIMHNGQWHSFKMFPDAEKFIKKIKIKEEVAGIGFPLFRNKWTKRQVRKHNPVRLTFSRQHSNLSRHLFQMPPLLEWNFEDKIQRSLQMNVTVEQ